MFWQRSLVPAMIATALGLRRTTSCMKRASIWLAVCPLIPRPAKLFFSKKSGSLSYQKSVIESPISTKSGASAIAAFFSSYRLKLGQS